MFQAQWTKHIVDRNALVNADLWSCVPTWHIQWWTKFCEDSKTEIIPQLIIHISTCQADPTSVIHGIQHFLR